MPQTRLPCRFSHWVAVALALALGILYIAIVRLETPLPAYWHPVIDRLRPLAASQWFPASLIPLEGDDQLDEGTHHSDSPPVHIEEDSRPIVEHVGVQEVSKEDQAPRITSCPHPYLESRPLQLDELDRDSCLAVETSNTDYTLQLCPLRSSTVPTCNSFSVLISRKDATFCTVSANRTAGLDLSATPGEGDWVKDNLGPDAFQVEVSGAERYIASWPSAYNEAMCEWRYDVVLRNGGDFRVSVHLYYESYQAFSEVWEDEIGPWHGKEWPGKGRVPAWPRLLDKSLTKAPISSHLFRSPIACPANCPSYSFDDRKRLTPEPPIAYDALPLCSRTDVIPRAYLPDPHPYRSDPKQAVAKYRGTPLGCRFSQVDVQLLDTSLPLATRAACLATKKRRITIQGDSHARMLYDALLPRLLGKNLVPDYYKSRFKARQIGATRLEFAWDPQMYSLRPDKAAVLGASKPSEVDYLILSTGAHQCFYHTPTRKFLDGISKLSDTLAKRNAAKRPTLYISSPAYPPRDGQYVWDNRDWRNNYRLANWTTEAREMFASMGARVSDGFGSTLPFDRDSPDHAHYRDTPAIEWWMTTTMHKLALCSVA